jgi:hypothetical protein
MSGSNGVLFALVTISLFPLFSAAPSAVAQTNNAGTSLQSFKGIVAPARSYDIAPPFDGQVIRIANGRKSEFLYQQLR